LHEKNFLLCNELSNDDVKSYIDIAIGFQSVFLSAHHREMKFLVMVDVCGSQVGQEFTS